MRGSAWRIGLGAWVALLAVACGACCFALTPSPSPTLWERGVPDNTNRTDRVHNCSPPAGSPRFARGTETRARSVPPARRGNLKEGVSSRACFYKLCPRDRYKGTSLGFAVCSERTPFCPHPQPLSHCVGEGSRFWSAEASASAWAEALLPHSTIPLSHCVGEGSRFWSAEASASAWADRRAGEGDIGGEGSALQIRATDYTLTRTPDGGLLLELAGKVRVEYQGRRLEGERLLLDTDAELVRSEEPFRLFAEQGALTGRRGEYFYGQARGRFEGVQANVLGVYLDAALLEGDLTDFTARAVVVSTCDPFRPPIQVRAGRVRLARGARLTLRNARLFIYGQPLPSLPQLTVRVGETAEVVSLPSPVYSAETGWGARARLELPLGERALLQASAASYLRAWRAASATAASSRKESPMPSAAEGGRTQQWANCKSGVWDRTGAAADASGPELPAWSPDAVDWANPISSSPGYFSSGQSNRMRKRHSAGVR